MTHRIRTFLLALALGLPVAANAQVTTDPSVLDSLTKPAPAAPQRPAARPHPRPPAATHPAAHPAAPAKPIPPVAAKPAAPLPTVPPAPPPVAVIPPPVIVPTLPQPPPPPVPVVATASGAASPIDHGTRITFGADSADLNPTTQAALSDVAHQARDQASAAVNVLAHAPGTPDDPSTPRRLSLSRALAARAVLINQGIPSTRIYVRALGPLELGDGPADRVDVVLGPIPAPRGAPPWPDPGKMRRSRR